MTADVAREERTGRAPSMALQAAYAECFEAGALAPGWSVDLFDVAWPKVTYYSPAR
jgi:hypothetical protein